LNEKYKRFNLWPIACCITIVVTIAIIATQLPPWLAAAVAILGTGSTAAAHMRDKLANSVVIMYDLDDSLCSTFRDTFSTFMRLNECGAVWHVTAKGQVYERKYHAGADSLVRRDRLSVVERMPRCVKSNISIACVPLGRESLFLLPDLILIASNNGFGAIPYSELSVLITETNFIENQRVPHDARVVGRTWRYVNKDGGPDSRFNNNRELPICKYEEVRFSSATGLNELIQISRTGYGQLLRSSINAMSHAIESLRRIESKQHGGELSHISSGQSQAAINSQARGAGIASSSALPETQSLDVVYDALLDILCSVMVADGRASKSERACIVDLMRKVNSNMTDEEVEQRIDHYIGAISSHGYQHVLAQTLTKVSIFKRIGKQDVLSRCIDAVIASDSKIDAREKALCDRIKQLANA
jgi:hypothetical protein